MAAYGIRNASRGGGVSLIFFVVHTGAQGENAVGEVNTHTKEGARGIRKEREKLY